MIACGARPNFMKVAPIVREAKQRNIDCRIFYSNQHYDTELSSVFFADLGIPFPDFYMTPTKGSHAEQTAKVMIDFEKVCSQYCPDLVIVVGDVNTTLACAITAKKLQIQVAHIEAGLRSFDMTMPEEINRKIVDSISDLLFCTEGDAFLNLHKEGKRGNLVGNVMIDNLFFQLQNCWIENNLPDEYIFLTLHRPSNVDSKPVLLKIIDIVSEISYKFVPVIFIVHPRTREALQRFNIKLPDTIRQYAPLGFTGSLSIWKGAKVVLTDSGGLQEETTALGVPCLTLRKNTERPCTEVIGTNTVVGADKEKIIQLVSDIFVGQYKKGAIPELWDGKAAERIINIIMERGIE